MHRHSSLIPFCRNRLSEMKKSTLLVLVACVLISCSDDTKPGNSNNSTTSNNTTPTNNVTVPASPCGEAAPVANSACTNEGLVCEYGEDPRPNCRTLSECTAGSWLVTVPRCEAIPDATCPTTLEAAAGELCDTQDAWCTYDGLHCECTNCVQFPVGFCQGDPRWRCQVPHMEEGCPTAMPHLGTTCAENQKTCEYKCGEGGARICESNVWTSGEGGPCPISTARLKTDISYLDSSKLAQLSNELQSLKVASWKYSSPALGEGVRYGIIVEDAPDSSAVDINRQMVDLYGLTSLLIADAQVKDLEIKALRAEIEKLKNAK